MRMILLIDDGMPVEREWETLDEVDIDDDENDNNKLMIILLLMIMMR